MTLAISVCMAVGGLLFIVAAAMNLRIAVLQNGESNAVAGTDHVKELDPFDLTWAAAASLFLGVLILGFRFTSGSGWLPAIEFSWWMFVGIALLAIGAQSIVSMMKNQLGTQVLRVPGMAIVALGALAISFGY